MSRTDEHAALVLTSDLDHWEVVLTSGEGVSLRAHSYAEREGCYVFLALMQGTPRYEYELVRFPASIVEDVDGGRQAPPGGSQAVP